MTLPEGAPPREPSCHFSEDLWKCAVVAKKFSRTPTSNFDTIESAPLPKSNKRDALNHTGTLFLGIALLTLRLLIVVC